MGVDYTKCDHCKNIDGDCGETYWIECEQCHGQMCIWCIQEVPAFQALPDGEEEKYQDCEETLFTISGKFDTFLRKEFCPVCIKGESLRTFKLVRKEDVSGVSGIGVVAIGVEFPSKRVVIEWKGEMKSLGIFKDVQELLAIHGHEGKTRVEWI